jgi:hypothetical protein
MSDLNRREVMKHATAAGVVASASAVLTGTVRAEADQGPTQEGQQSTRPSHHVPVSIFIRGKQQIQLTGKKVQPGAPGWGATADDPSIALVTVEPVQIAHFPVQYWELTIVGLKMGTTRVQVEERQASTNPPNVLYHFVLDVTVLGLLE